ncbi:hypothetical protein BaRGS_00024436 [Batillaria attramentaria]|uniref:Uncharacterized protein n=1 Tax=Batillaria attramentaria TaxID=370345 RepID=A0ABD0KBF4_9CAEN
MHWHPQRAWPEACYSWLSSSRDEIASSICIQFLKKNMCHTFRKEPPCLQTEEIRFGPDQRLSQTHNSHRSRRRKGTELQTEGALGTVSITSFITRKAA